MAVWQKVSRITDHKESVLFLDRDGVMIVDQDYLADPEGVILLPGVAAAIKRAQKEGLLVVGVSNQSGLGRDLFQLKDFELVMGRLTELLAAEGAAMDGFYYCPHTPEDHCPCRKPELGLLTEVSESLAWEPSTSWVVGDKKSDITLGRRAQMGSVLIGTGYGAASKAEVVEAFSEDTKVLYANDMSEALALILERSEMKSRGDAL